MRIPILAALALAAASSLQAQAIADLATATPVGGNWAWAQTADGSEAVFTGADSKPQVTIHCARSTRRVTISKAASAAAPFLAVWTSSQTQELARELQCRDRQAQCRGGGLRSIARCDRRRAAARIGFGASGLAPLVVPPWAEVARVDRGLPRLSRREAAKCDEYSHHYKSCVVAHKNHLRFGFNAAKGGDPMSHGSAGRSERGVRRL